MRLKKKNTSESDCMPQKHILKKRKQFYVHKVNIILLRSFNNDIDVFLYFSGLVTSKMTNFHHLFFFFSLIPPSIPHLAPSCSVSQFQTFSFPGDPCRIKVGLRSRSPPDWVGPVTMGESLEEATAQRVASLAEEVSEDHRVIILIEGACLPSSEENFPRR